MHHRPFSHTFKTLDGLVKLGVARDCAGTAGIFNDPCGGGQADLRQALERLLVETGAPQ